MPLWEVITLCLAGLALLALLIRVGLIGFTFDVMCAIVSSFTDDEHDDKSGGGPFGGGSFGGGGSSDDY